MSCEAVRERDFSLLGRVVVDMSGTGMLLRTDKHILTGEPVIVSFVEPASGQWFDLQTTVARVVHGRRKRDAERGVALSFDSLADGDRTMLESALHKRVPRLPSAR